MSSILNFSDLLAGAFGIVGSAALGWPLLADITDKREWDLFRNFRERLGKDKTHILTPEELEAQRQLRDRLVDHRLGHHEKYRGITFFGFVCLLLAFAFQSAASISRVLP